VRFLRETPPLMATLGRCEVEFAAALILYGLHRLGRAWTEPVTAKDLGKTISDSAGAGLEPIRSWMRNPFLRPDWDDLVKRGFALRDETPDGDVLTLTPEALERVAGHIEVMP
jgi:hypothetical protein